MLALRVEVVGGGGIAVAGTAGGSTVSGSGRGRDVAAGQTSALLADKSLKLVLPATLGNLDTLLIEPLLELVVIPRVDELVGESSLSCSSRGGELADIGCSLSRGDTGVAADRSYQLVAVVRLRSWNTALVEPGLEVRVRPGLVEPVTRVGGSLLELVGDSLVVTAGRLKERVTVAWGRVGDLVVVEEGLELRVGPARCTSVLSSPALHNNGVLTCRRSSPGR